MRSKSIRLSDALRYFLLACCFLSALASGPAVAQVQVDENTENQSEKIDQLVKGLNSSNYPDRESAQEELVAMGSSVLPQLKKIIEQPIEAEVKHRLMAVVKGLSEVNWRKFQETTIAAALTEAEQQSKLIFVFSTIGEVDGFS